jgi:hypothetical protein
MVGRGIRIQRCVNIGGLLALLFWWHAAIAANSKLLAPAIPRTSGGRPDLSGIWQAANTAANWNILTHGSAPGPAALGAIGAVQPGVGIVVGDEIPYLPVAAAKQRENYAKRWSNDPELKCYQAGVPRANYMAQPLQIFQSSFGKIAIAYQYANGIRIINMDQATEAPIDTWMGWSNGHWDHDTLVIDVTGFNGMAWLDRAGNFAGSGLHVVERYRLASPDIIDYEATLTDPETYSRPWQIRFKLVRNPEPNARLMEFNCVEYAEELLYGHLRKKAAP